MADIFWNHIGTVIFSNEPLKQGDCTGKDGIVLLEGYTALTEIWASFITDDPRFTLSDFKQVKTANEKSRGPFDAENANGPQPVKPV